MPPRTDPARRKAVTPMAFVRAMVRAYERAGLDPAPALRQAQITPAALRRADARITAGQMETISGLAMQQLDDEALGWFSRRLPWGSYGMLCRASITSPQLGLALARWCRHHRLLTEDIVPHLQREGGVARLWIEEKRELGEMREICCVTLLRYVHGFACWAIDSRIPLREVTFPFPAPRHHDAYPLMFPGPVQFGAPHAGFAFDADYLALPLRRDERALQTMLQRALPLTVLQYRRDRLLAQRVRELLRSRTAELTDAPAIAAALNVSVRTLHRQLRDEGHALQALKDDARRERALELLERSTRPVKQIARDVGFRNEKSFARAFRGWTGSSPGEHRQRAGQLP
jgi:AraC-like DNA-binding protein